MEDRNKVKKTSEGPIAPLHYQHLLYSLTFFFFPPNHPGVETLTESIISLKLQSRTILSGSGEDGIKREKARPKIRSKEK